MAVKKTLSKMKSLKLPPGYGDFVQDLKSRIQSAQLKAAVSVNRELILLYWSMGHKILEQQKKEGWGAKVIERLSKDLTASFPGMKGFSVRNLVYMQTFAHAYPSAITQQAAAQIPWGHNMLILDKVENPIKREWYINKTVENGWSRAVLWHQIDSNLYQRQGINEKLVNFSVTLPKAQSDLARETLKDPYCFDFLTLAQGAQERDLERGLVTHIQEFLLELGVGFSFIGSQYHLQVGDLVQILHDTYSPILNGTCFLSSTYRLLLWNRQAPHWEAISHQRSAEKN